MIDTLVAFASHALFAFAINAVIVVAAMARILLRPHREPASRIAWIVVVIAFPGLGVLTYILLGEVNIGRRRVAPRAPGDRQYAADGRGCRRGRRSPQSGRSRSLSASFSRRTIDQWIPRRRWKLRDSAPRFERDHRLNGFRYRRRARSRSLTLLHLAGRQQWLQDRGSS